MPGTVSGDIMVLAACPSPPPFPPPPPSPSETFRDSALTLQHIARLTSNLAYMFTIMKSRTSSKVGIVGPMGTANLHNLCKILKIVRFERNSVDVIYIGSRIKFIEFWSHPRSQRLPFWIFAQFFFKFVGLEWNLVDVISNGSKQFFGYFWGHPMSQQRPFWIFAHLFKFVRL